MKIEGVGLGKKFGKHWIFRNKSFELSNTSVAITGKNGAGKSTLLQIIAGYLSPSEGEILINGDKNDEHDVNISFVAPYMEIIEEFTLNEWLTFHSKFRKPQVSFAEMAELASIPLHKSIATFSTGMKQRAKLITAFYFENDILFMDEPTANLDSEGFDWWGRNSENLKNKLIFIASNDPREIARCATVMKL